MSNSYQPGTPPGKPRPKVYLGMPDGYWSWPEAKQREWAQEAAKSLQAALLRSTVPEFAPVAARERAPTARPKAILRLQPLPATDHAPTAITHTTNAPPDSLPGA